MAKIIPPVKGLPVHEFLDNLWPEIVGEMRDPVVVAFLIKWRSSVNPDLCLSKDQAEGVRALLSAYLEADGEEPAYRLQAMEGMKRVDLNRYRLDCRNCLKADCSQRDPEFPLEAVIERAGTDECANKKRRDENREVFGLIRGAAEEK